MKYALETLVITVLLAASLLTATAQTFDGPAELPQRAPLATITTSGNVRPVGPTDSLRAVLALTQCGDVVSIDPTNVTSGNVLALTVNCDPSNGVVVTTSGPLLTDSQGRVLPDQPMPRIILGPNQTVNTASGVLWRGIKIERIPGGTLYNMVTSGSNVILDSMYIHGTPTDETVRGVAMYGGVKNVTIRNSRLTDFHCKALGSCGDAQGISFGIGDPVGSDSGNYNFENNYIEASGENILGGGGGGDATPTDIWVHRNTLRKPSSWMPGSPDYAGIPWIVKNHLECKNCARYLAEDNDMDGSWGGYTQLGWSILITAKNQAGHCPNCTVTDITIRNNRISRVGQFTQIGFVPDGGANPVFAKEQGRISIHDNIVRDLQYPGCYQCGQWMIQLSSSPGAPIPLHHVDIVNNSLYLAQWGRKGGFMAIGGPTAPAAQVNHINIVNNLFPGGTYPMYSVGGAGNCAASGTLDYAGMLAKCWTDSSFTGNVILTNGTTAKYIWPPNNSPVPVGAKIQ